MSDKKPTFNPVSEILSEAAVGMSHAKDSATAGELDEQTASTETDENYFRYLFTLGLLIVRPREALPILFAPPWPRYLITLSLSALVIPFVANFLVDYSRNYDQLFLALNQFTGIGPGEFKNLVFYTGSFSLFGIIAIGAVVQKLILRLQQIDLTLIDSFAILCYSAAPVLAAQVFLASIATMADDSALALLGISLNNPLSHFVRETTGFWDVLGYLMLFIANVWSVYIWYCGIQVLTKLSVRQIFAIGVLGALIPLLLLLVLLLFIFVIEADLFRKKPDSLEHIYDSLRLRERHNSLDQELSDSKAFPDRESAPSKRE